MNYVTEEEIMLLDVVEVILFISIMVLNILPEMHQIIKNISRT